MEAAGYKRKGYIPEVHLLYKKAKAEAKQNRLKLLRQEVRTTLLEAAQERWYEDTEEICDISEDGELSLRSKTVHMRLYVPPTNLLLFMAQSPTFRDNDIR